MKQAGAGKVKWGEHCLNSPSPLTPCLPRKQGDGSSAGEAAPRGCQSPLSTVTPRSRGGSAFSSQGCASVEQEPPGSSWAELRWWALGSQTAAGEGGQLEQFDSLTQGGHNNRCRCGSRGLRFRAGGSLWDSCDVSVAAAGLSRLHTRPGGGGAQLFALRLPVCSSGHGGLLTLELLYLSLLSWDWWFNSCYRSSWPVL